MSFQVCFKKVEDIVNFVSEVAEAPFHIDACCGSYIVDAKSVLGMMSIGIARNMELKLYTDDNVGELGQVIEAYAA